MTWFRASTKGLPHTSLGAGGVGGGLASPALKNQFPEILLPSARHLKEGRGRTIFELPKLENCMSRLCPSPLGSTPPPTQIG